MTLTPRQLAVLARYAMGETMKAIASDLGVSVKTIEYHMKRIKQRTGESTPQGLTRWAIRNGVIQA